MNQWFHGTVVLREIAGLLWFHYVHQAVRKSFAYIIAGFSVFGL
jgi:hypothetical protein